MTWLVDPVTGEPLVAIVPGVRPLVPLLPDVDYERRPRRIQRRRTKGWTMPAEAVYVGRPTKWGNPYTLKFARSIMGRDDGESWAQYIAGMREWCVVAYRDMCVPDLVGDMWRRLAPLRGHDLACWCPLDAPCHADVLLELANR